MKRIVKFCAVMIAVAFCTPAFAQNVKNDPLDKEIEAQLTLPQANAALYFPNSVKRFYQQRDFEPAWIKPQSGTGQAWQAMLMIDCVLQFGLSHKDYHPDELLYATLHDILDHYNDHNLKAMAHYDIILTDAIITLMNHLHYGKLNPNYTYDQIDMGMTDRFQADLYLKLIIDKQNLMENIAKVQPQCQEYVAMQTQMHILKGLYVSDCYEVPEADIRKIAINMERLRWAEIDDSDFILINIPSYKLKVRLADSEHQFKVIVGKPATPTPTLQSKIKYFTTAPDWRVPRKIFVKEVLPKALADTSYLKNGHFSIYDNNGKYVDPNVQNLSNIKHHSSLYHATQAAGCDNALGAIVFRFDNIYDVYLHDTPEQNLFGVEKRDLSHGCIRVEEAEKLATLLLQNDRSAGKIAAMHKAIKAYKTLNFLLSYPLPIKITYLTCEIKDAELVTYADIYDLDKRLEMALYGLNAPLSSR